MTKISDKLRQAGAKDRSIRKEPLWSGPCGDGPNGGVSYSLLSRFLTCQERFRVQVIDGLMPIPTFRAPLDFGNMWHICEEAHAKDGHWLEPLQSFCKKLSKQYPTQLTQIQHWYELCKAEFPLYVSLWKQEQEDNDIWYLFQEQPFDLRYTLPSGAKIRLRGKWDSVYTASGKKGREIWLQENKTKSQIDLTAISRQLSFDLQTMLYLVALSQSVESAKEIIDVIKDVPIVGVRYNVVRRSAHKSAESMVEKIQLDYRCGRIQEWFSRLDTRIAQQDINTFKQQCLDPLLETVNNWYNAIVAGKKSFVAHHYRHPFGVRNILDEGGASDLDNYLLTGSRVGLTNCSNLFPELQDL